MSRDSSRTRAAAQPRPRALHPIIADLSADAPIPLRSVLLPDFKDGGDKPMTRRVDLCGTYGCTLPDMRYSTYFTDGDELFAEVLATAPQMPDLGAAAAANEEVRRCVNSM